MEEFEDIMQAWGKARDVVFSPEELKFLDEVKADILPETR